MTVKAPAGLSTRPKEMVTVCVSGRPLQGASALASADRCAGGSHAIRIPCSAAAALPGDGHGQAVLQQHAVRQAGQRIVERPPAELGDVAGMQLIGDGNAVTLQPQQVLSLPLTVTAPAGTSGRHDVQFVVEAVEGDTRAVVDSSFFGPTQ